MSLLPARTVLGQHVRCMVSHHLFKIPGFGRTMGEHSGSFPVHFSTKSAIVVNKSEDADGFGTDKTKQQLVQERVAAHVVGGGVRLGEIVVFLCVVAIALDVLSLDETLDALF